MYKLLTLCLLFTVNTWAAPSCQDLFGIDLSAYAAKKMKTALRYHKDRKPIEAEKILRELIRLNPNDYRALGMLSKIRYELKSFDKALRYQWRVIKLEPEYREASYVAIVQILWAMKSYQRASEFIEVILAHNPGHHFALGLKSRYLLMRFELEKAFEVIMSKMEIDPFDPHTLRLLGEYHYKNGDYSSSRKIANRLIEENKPTSRQKRVPKPYIVGLALGIKSSLAMNKDMSRVVSELATLQSYFSKPPLWLTKMHLEVLFKTGQMELALKLAVQELAKADKVDIEIAAIIFRITEYGDRSDSTNVANALRSVLPKAEQESALQLAQSQSWDYIPSIEPGKTPKSMKSSFWMGLDTIPIDRVANRTSPGWRRRHPNSSGRY